MFDSLWSPANAGEERHVGLIPGLSNSPGEGSGNPFQYSCLENAMDSGASQATVHRVVKSQKELKRSKQATVWGIYVYCCCCSVTQSCPTLQPHGLQHTKLPCLSLSPGVCSNSCPLSWWYHPTQSSSVTCFSSCPQSFQISGSFPMSQLFATGP